MTLFPGTRDEPGPAASNDEASGTIVYEFDLTTGALTSPKWITLEGKELNELASPVLAS